MAKFNVLYFGPLKDATGLSSELIEPNQNTASGIFDTVKGKYPEIKELIESSMVCVDLNYVDPETTISPDSEIAIIPPVSGGDLIVPGQIKRGQVGVVGCDKPVKLIITKPTAYLGRRGTIFHHVVWKSANEVNRVYSNIYSFNSNYIFYYILNDN